MTTSDAVSAEELMELAEEAWAIIANAGGWPGKDSATEGWHEAAVRWRDQYHSVLDRWVEPKALCCIEHPEGWVCTREPNHDGLHQAWGYSDESHPYATWE